MITTTKTKKKAVTYAYSYIHADVTKAQYRKRLKLFFEHVGLDSAGADLDEQGQAFLDQARETIERDFLNVWTKRTIKDNLPEEALHTEKRNKEKKVKDAEMTSAYEDKKVIVEVSNTGEQGPYIPEANVFNTTPTNVFANNNVEQVEQQQTLVLVLPPNLTWRSKIMQRMNQGANIYIVHNGKQVIDVRDKP